MENLDRTFVEMAGGDTRNTGGQRLQSPWTALLPSTVVPANSPLAGIEVWKRNNAGRDALLVTIELTDLDLGAERRMGHIHATQRDDLSEDG